MERDNKNTNRDTANSGINYQDSPHNEGQQHNINSGSGQTDSHNVSRSVSEMNQPSSEQKAGRENQTKEERNQQDKP